MEISEVERQLALLRKAFLHVSAANGATVDALLTIVVPLAERGTISREQATGFLAATRLLNEQTLELNSVLAELEGIAIDADE
ncbi:hypothetical protein NG726_11710 [Pseudomonas sp. MOB-449]|nr:hypothetical protein [Pseudomonas sp. MOB-449]